MTTVAARTLTKLCSALLISLILLMPAILRLLEGRRALVQYALLLNKLCLLSDGDSFCLSFQPLRSAVPSIRFRAAAGTQETGG